jgi:gliding motility-associated-like protein
LSNQGSFQLILLRLFWMSQRIKVFIFFIFLAKNGLSQNKYLNLNIGSKGKPLASCNNWLYLASQPASMDVGDLDVPGNQITVEAEINRTTPYVGGFLYAGDIVSKHKDPININYLLRPSDAEITTADGVYHITPPVCDIELNKTYHVALVYDGSMLKFYRDGFLLSQTPVSGNLFQNDFHTEIGYYQAQLYNENFIGYINEVRIWNVARTQAQIQAYMNTSLPSPSTQPGLLAYYTFNDILNKQGNAAWNGVLSGASSINQTNPTCAGFTADNYCCPVLDGNFSGSLVCSGTYAKLIFQSTTPSTGPFKLTYTDGSTIFTSDNVQNGVPFLTTDPINQTTEFWLTNIQDATGCSGAPASDVAAVAGVENCDPCTNWLGLPGQPSYADVGNLNITGNQLTIEAEINRTASYTEGTPEEGDIVSKHSDLTDVNYLLRPNHAYISTTDGNFATPDICDISLNKTYHVAMVYDGTTLKFYRNGFLMSQVPATGNLIQNAWNTRIGYYFNQALNENFIGYINEVRIWNVARTQAEIQANLNTSLPAPASQPGLQAYYIFSDMLNKQGNPAWNGILGGSAAITQTNPDCSFVADNTCCPPVQATFTGNNICPGQTGTLTIFPVSTHLNPPYTLSYSDQITTYTQTNVQAGVPFAVPVNPMATTKYPLLKLTDAANCSTDFTADSATITIFTTGNFKVTPDTSICVNSSVQLNASGGQTYAWSPVAYLDNPNIPNPVARPGQATKFYVSGKDLNNCSELDSVMINLLPVPVFKAPADQTVCKGMSVVLGGSNGREYKYVWSPAALVSDPYATNPSVSPQETTTFHLVISDSVCSQYDSAFDIHVLVNEPPVVTAQKSNDINCSVLSSTLTAGGAGSYSWSPGINLNDSLSANPVVSASATTHFIVRGKAANGCYGYDSVTVLVTKTGENLFSVPNAFTPNNDGLNDCFGIHNWGSVTLRDLSIYNRWGQRVFETKNIADCWDGTFQGVQQEAGGFVYIIRASSFCEENIVRTGTLLLIR